MPPRPAQTPLSPSEAAAASAAAGTDDTRYGETREQAVRGGRAMLARHFTVALVSLAGSTFLIRALGPGDWASYSIAYFLVVFLDGAFGANLLGALVRAPELPSPPRVATATGVMHLTGLAVAVLVALAALPAAQLYGRDELAVCLLAVAVCAYVYASRSVSLALLERRLEYRWVALAEIVDQLTFYALAIPLVLLDYGISGVAVALALRGALAAFLLRRVSPTPLVGFLDRDEARLILGFAVPTLGSSSLVLVTGLVPVVALGGDHATELAYVMTAGTIVGYAATSQVILHRVGFPSLAVLQEQPSMFRAAMERAIALTDFLLVTAIVPLGATSPFWLPLLFGDGWETASQPLIAIGVGLLFNSINTVGVSALNSIDQPRQAFRLQLSLTLSYVVLAFPLVAVSPVLGPPLAYALSRVLGVLLSDRLLRASGHRIPLLREAFLLVLASGSMAGLALLVAYDQMPVAFACTAGLLAAWLWIRRREATAIAGLMLGAWHGVRPVRG